MPLDHLRSDRRPLRRNIAVAALVLIVGLGLNAAAPGGVVEARRAPTYDRSCGWYGCTVHFNASETNRIASGTIGATTFVAGCSSVGGPWGAVACAAVSAPAILWAQSAQSQGKLLGMTVSWVDPRSPISFFTYAPKPAKTGGCWRCGRW